MDEPAINPIVDFKNVDDFVVWGAKTLPRQPVAMDRVGVRRLCLYMEKSIRQLIRSQRHMGSSIAEIVEKSNPLIDQFLEDCRLRRAFESYEVGTFCSPFGSEINVTFKRPESEKLTLIFTIRPEDSEELPIYYG